MAMIATLTIGLSLLAFLVALVCTLMVLRGMRRLAFLQDVPVPTAVPRLSVIVPALNEATTIEPAMRSLLNADYPDLELIAVNDRSTDGTGAILDRLAAKDARLQVVHIAELPSGWLGKVHAMQAGLERASGAYVLFTDADVVFTPLALKQAVGHALAERLDHLTVAPQMDAESNLLRVMIMQQALGLLVRHRPWRIRYDRNTYLGIGAFNLVRRDLLCAHAGLAPIALSPADDLMLGKLVKQLGGRADMLLGTGSLRIAWYPSAAAMVRGLGKNVFAYLDYSLTKLIGASLPILLMFWPFLGIFVGPLAGRLLSAGALAVTGLLYWASLRKMRADEAWPLLPVLAYSMPAALVMLYAMWRASLLTLWRQEIEWRGTRYPLRELRMRRL